MTLVVLLFLLTATAGGFGVARFLTDDLSKAEVFAWSFAAGLLVQFSIEMALLSVRLRPGPKKLAVAEAAILTVSLMVRRTRFPRGIRLGPRGRIEPLVAVLLVVATAAVAIYISVAMSSRMWATDYLAIWGMKGRMIFATASIPASLFHDPALNWAHPEYPLLVPVTLAALAAATRAWDDQALALIYPFCQLATVLAVFGVLRRHVSITAGAVGACLTALCFPLYSSGNVGTGEIPLALGFVLAAAAALDAEAGAGAASARLALASFFCVEIKQEGTLFMVILAGAILLRQASIQRERRQVWLWALAPVLVNVVATHVLRGPVARRDFDLTLLEPHRWNEFANRLGIVARRLMTVEIRHTGIAIAAVLFFLLLMRGRFAIWLLAPILLQEAAYAIACALCAFGPIWLIETSFSRITLALFPVLALVLGAQLHSGSVARPQRPSVPLFRHTGV